MALKSLLPFGRYVPPRMRRRLGRQEAKKKYEKAKARSQRKKETSPTPSYIATPPFLFFHHASPINLITLSPLTISLKETNLSPRALHLRGSQSSPANV